MLAGTGLGDDAGLSHAPGELDLAQAIVDLVAAGVIELITLEIDLGAAVDTGGSRDLAQVLGQAFGEIKWARPTSIVGVEFGELALKDRIGLGGRVGALQIEDQRHQGFGDEAAPELAKKAVIVGPAAIGIGFVGLRLHLCVNEPQAKVTNATRPIPRRAKLGTACWLGAQRKRPVPLLLGVPPLGRALGVGEEAADQLGILLPRLALNTRGHVDHASASDANGLGDVVG